MARRAIAACGGVWMLAWVLPSGVVAQGIDRCAADSASESRVLSRVRSLDGRLGLALDEGYERSPTVRRLVDILDRSDLIVYLAATPCMQGQPGACTQVAAGRAGHRFARINLRPAQALSRVIAMMGHELQHAVEIAAAPEVVDAPSLAALFQRIGVRVRSGVETYETTAAIRAGEIVTAELKANLTLPSGERGCLSPRPPSP